MTPLPTVPVQPRGLSRRHIAIAAGPQKPATVPQEPLRVVWKLKAGDTLLQELIISRKPTFRTQGLSFQSMLKYSVTSRFVVEEAGPAGVIINQRIEGARLIQADA